MATAFLFSRLSLFSCELVASQYTFISRHFTSHREILSHSIFICMYFEGYGVLQSQETEELSLVSPVATSTPLDEPTTHVKFFTTCPI